MSGLALYITTTRECNLACPHCFQTQHGTKRKAPEKLQETIEFVIDNPNINSVTLLGGEAMFDEDGLRKVLEAFALIAQNRKDFRCNFITNGTVYLPWLKDYKAFVRNLQFSIDGGAEYHNIARRFINGDPSFYEVVDNLHRYKADGFSVSVHAVFDPNKIDLFVKSLPEMAAYLGEDVGFNCEMVRFVAKEKPIKEFLALRKLYKTLDFLHDNGYKVGTSRGIYYGGSSYLQVCRSGSTFLGMDATDGRLFDCHETIGSDSSCIGDYKGVNKDFEERIKYHDWKSYRFAKLPRWLSYILIRTMGLNSCWRENINTCGKYNIIPLRLLTLNLFARHYGAKWGVYHNGRPNGK